MQCRVLTGSLGTSQVEERVLPLKNRCLAQLLLDLEEPIVLSDPLTSIRRARFDLPRVGREREVGNSSVARLARPMGDDGSPPA